MKQSLCCVLALIAGCAAQDKMAWPVATAQAPQEIAPLRAPPYANNGNFSNENFATDTDATDRASLCAAGAIDCTEDPSGDTLAAPKSAHVHFIWPLDDARAITSKFGVRSDPIEAEQIRFHRGIDLAATYGAMVRASASGMVTDGRWAGGYGRHVSISHGQGWVSTYSHLSLLLVQPGTWVEAGDPIGLVGESGRATGPHLHFEILNARGAVNPLRLLGSLPESLAVR